MSELTFDVGLAAKLKQAVIRNGITDLADIDWLCEGENLANMRRLRQGHALLTVPEPVLDFLVRVDRSVKPSYPDWMKKVMNPELELAGPAEYNLQTGVEQWLHDVQKRGSGVGNTIYKHLQKGDALATCLNLQDALAIQAKGIAVFRRLFADKAVFLWGSVVQSRSGNLNVPYLVEIGGKVVVNWFCLDNNWNFYDPALRFSK